jgi:hypothetical protein
VSEWKHLQDADIPLCVREIHMRKIAQSERATNLHVDHLPEASEIGRWNYLLATLEFAIVDESDKLLQLFAHEEPWLSDRKTNEIDTCGGLKKIFKRNWIQE